LTQQKWQGLRCAIQLNVPTQRSSDVTKKVVGHGAIPAVLGHSSWKTPASEKVLPRKVVVVDLELKALKGGSCLGRLKVTGVHRLWQRKRRSCGDKKVSKGHWEQVPTSSHSSGTSPARHQVPLDVFSISPPASSYNDGVIAEVGSIAGNLDD
jgi:hypothetical protein